MDNLNLDIDTYSLEDLSKLFNLKDEYNEIDIDNEKQTLLLQLRDIGDIGVEKKRNITFFIDCAAGRLITMANDKKTDENQGTWSQLKNDTIQEGSHTIIESPNIKAGQVASFSDGRTAGSNNTPPGFLNPINVKSFARGVNIDSRFRDNYYSTHSHDYVVSLPDTYRKVTEMRIGSIELPMTMYAISKHSGNNTFVIKDTSNNNAWLLTVPDGNYEISWQDQSVAQDIITTMNQAISMAIPGTIDECGKFVIDLSKNPLDPTRDICYTIDRNTGRSIFANVINNNQNFAMQTTTDIIEKINELSNNELDMSDLSMSNLSNIISNTKTNINLIFNPCINTHSGACVDIRSDTSYNALTHKDLENIYSETRVQKKKLISILIDSSYSEANKLIKINNIIKDTRSLNNTINIIDTKLDNIVVGNIIDDAINLQEITEKIIYNYKNINVNLQKIEEETENLINIKYKNTENFCNARNNYENAKEDKCKSLDDASKNINVVKQNEKIAVSDASNNFEKALKKYNDLQDASSIVLNIFRNFHILPDNIEKIKHYKSDFINEKLDLDTSYFDDLDKKKIEYMNSIETTTKELSTNIILAIDAYNLYITKNDIGNFVNVINNQNKTISISNETLYIYAKDSTGAFQYYNFINNQLRDPSNCINSIFKAESLLELSCISRNPQIMSEFSDLNSNFFPNEYVTLLYLEAALRFAFIYSIMNRWDVANRVANGTNLDKWHEDVLKHSENRKNVLMDLIKEYENTYKAPSIFDLCGNQQIDISGGVEFEILNETFTLENGGSLTSPIFFKPSDEYLFDLLDLVLDSSNGNLIGPLGTPFSIKGGVFNQTIPTITQTNTGDWDIARDNFLKCSHILLNFVRYKFSLSNISGSAKISNNDLLATINDNFYDMLKEYSKHSRNNLREKIYFDTTFLDQTTKRLNYNANSVLNWLNNTFTVWSNSINNNNTNLLNRYKYYCNNEIKDTNTYYIDNNSFSTKIISNDSSFNKILTDLSNIEIRKTQLEPNTFYDKNSINTNYNIDVTQQSQKILVDIDNFTNDISYNYYIENIRININKNTITEASLNVIEYKIDNYITILVQNSGNSGLLKLAEDAFNKSKYEEDKILEKKVENVLGNNSATLELYMNSLADKTLAENMKTKLDEDWDTLNSGLWAGDVLKDIKANFVLIHTEINDDWGSSNSKRFVSDWWFGKDSKKEDEKDATTSTEILKATQENMNTYFEIILKDNTSNPGENLSFLKQDDIKSVKFRIFDYYTAIKKLKDKKYSEFSNLDIVYKMEKYKSNIDHFNNLVTWLLKMLLSIEDKNTIMLYFKAIIGDSDYRNSWASGKQNNNPSWWGEMLWNTQMPMIPLNVNDPQKVLDNLMDMSLKSNKTIKVYKNNLPDESPPPLPSPPANFRFIDTYNGIKKKGYTYLYKFIRWDFYYFYYELEEAISTSLSSNGSITENYETYKDNWEEENKKNIQDADETAITLEEKKSKLMRDHTLAINYYNISLILQKKIIEDSNRLLMDEEMFINIDNIIFYCSSLLTSSISCLSYELYHIESKINLLLKSRQANLKLAHVISEIAVDALNGWIDTTDKFASHWGNLPVLAVLSKSYVALTLAGISETSLRVTEAEAFRDTDVRESQMAVNKTGAELQNAIETKYNSKVKLLSITNEFLRYGVKLKKNINETSEELLKVKSIWDAKVKDSIDYYDITNEHEIEVNELARQKFCKVISENQAIELESITNIEYHFDEILEIIGRNNTQIETKKNNSVVFGEKLQNLNNEMIISFASIIPNNWEILFNVDVNGNVDLTENLQLRLGWMLGFRAGCYKPDIVDGAAVTSEGICLVSPPRYLFISINDGQKSQGTGLVAAYSQSSLDSNIMTRINCAATMDSTKVFKCASDVGLSNQLNRTRQYFGPVNISRLHIQVLDEYGRHVSLNHMDWSLTLVFDQLYD